MKKHITIFLFAILIFTSCKTEVQKVTGSITGKVDVFKDYGIRLEDETITIKIASLNISTQIKGPGQFVINDIPVGSYEVSFCSPNTTEIIRRGIQVLGGDVPTSIYKVILVKKPEAKIINLRTFFNSSNAISFDVEHNHDVFVRQRVKVYIGQDENVSKNNYDYSFSIVAKESNDVNIYGEIGTSPSGLYVVAYTKFTSFSQSFFPDYYNLSYDIYSLNYDEYGMNPDDPGISDIPSTIIKMN